MSTKRSADGGGGWNPYLAGALAGALAVVSALATTAYTGRTRYLGASTTFVRAAGYVERAVAPRRVEESPYYRKTAPAVDWQFLFVGGILLGSLVASMTDRSFRMESVPPIWKDRFGGRVARRAAAAFLAGIVAMIGARMADGCPSGHGLSGVMQLSVSGLAALPVFFLSGVIVARLVYGGGRP